MRPSGDTARGLVFDDFVDKQVVHVSATSFRSGAELVSMSRWWMYDNMDEQKDVSCKNIN